jgi:hypothetical protein
MGGTAWLFYARRRPLWRVQGIERSPGVSARRWLKKSIAIQWDYKNIVKRKGKLERLK